MLWEDDDRKKDTFVVPDDVVDLSFRISCTQIPTTHAWPLSQALYDALPWLRDAPETGIHQIHGATTGNGWERPADGELMQLSRRTRLTLRVGRDHRQAATALTGKTLDIDGHLVEVGEVSVKLMNPFETIFARYIIMPDGMEDENAFIHWAAGQLAGRGIAVRKMLCGKSHEITTPEKTYTTRSLMIADLDKAASLALQERGIGEGRHLGCGIFMPHKGIRPVGDQADKSHFTGT